MLAELVFVCVACNLQISDLDADLFAALQPVSGSLTTIYLENNPVVGVVGVGWALSLQWGTPALFLCPTAMSCCCATACSAVFLGRGKGCYLRYIDTQVIRENAELHPVCRASSEDM